jgi:hypothetical protein
MISRDRRWHLLLHDAQGRGDAAMIQEQRAHSNARETRIRCLDRPPVRLFLLSLLALFLELTVIRWVPGSVRLVSYYANLMLISSFLGLGIGAMVADRGRGLIEWFPVFLAADIVFLAASRNTLLPGTAVELRFYSSPTPGLVSYLVLVGVFLLNALLFLPIGEQIGRLFGRLNGLRAYAWDLGGSLAGTLLFALFAVTHFSPQLGLLIAVTLFALLFPGGGLGARLLLLFLLLVPTLTTEWRATWSAYNYLSIRQEGDTSRGLLSQAPTPPPDLSAMRNPPSYTLSVNQNFYQYHRSIDLRRFTQGTTAYVATDTFRVPYLIPFDFQPAPRTVAVVGAGGGLDVEAALLHGAEHVDAVEIDPAIIRLAKRYSAGGAYRSPRVQVHIDDARAFFHRATPGYDLVVFGLLDSQALFSSMANIRLDGFVYTVEGIRAAWRLLNDRGVLSLAFGTTSRTWLAGKLYRMVTEATGQEPRAYAELATGNIVLIVEKVPRQGPPERFERFVRWHPSAADLKTPPATDDWPYLYLRQRTVPVDYLVVILSLLAISVAVVLWLKPRGAGVPQLHFFALGVGFLLLETKSIVDSSLYFGGTWIVSLIVICGVLLMIMFANAVAARIETGSGWLYVPLLVSVLIMYVIPHESVLALSFVGRLVWTGLIVPLPLFFAGLIFSSSLKHTVNPAVALGANLLGAMVGGFAEYVGMAVGSRALALGIAGAYLLSWYARTIGRRGTPVAI